MSAKTPSGGRRRLRSALLLDFFDLVHQVVGLFDQVGTRAGAVGGVGLAAIEQIQIGHGVVVIGTQLDGLLEIGNAFVNQRTIFCNIVGAHCRGQRVGVLDLLLDVLFVVVLAHFAVGAEGQRPVNDADPVIGLGIFRLQCDVFLVIGLGFVKQLGVVRRARHLEENGADAVNGAEIVRIGAENVLELLDGLPADVTVLLGGRSGNVLAGVSRGEIETGVEE